MSDGKRKYMVATDVGGTCTDTVVFAAGEPVRLGKALSTPANFADGVLDSIRSAAQTMNLSIEDLLAQTKLFVHGSTVVDNIVLTRNGSKVGLITTRGFEDTLLITRAAYGRWGGLTEDRIKHPVKTGRAPSLVDPDCIVGVAERVDYKGEILLPLDAAEAERAIRFLVEQKKVEAIAVSFLWSFANAENERRMREVVALLAPHVYCSLSSEVAPVPGEYERTSTTAINAYAGRTTRSYLSSLSQLLIGAGYDGPLLVMQGYGGLLPAAEAAERSIGMLECGPAAGVIGSRALGQLLDQSDVIATDMGGTTFKVSVIQNHEIEYAREPMVDRYHYTQPKIEVVSIGAGGGSVVSFDASSSSLRIGPRSAGSRPGPACYGLGGTEPTVTDVLMLIGYMDPEIFLGGSMKLDRDAAKLVFDRVIAKPLGMTPEQAAFGAYRVACAQISDLIHEITVERGLDPREFVLHAFGGCCGMLAGVFGFDLHVKQIVVPYTASVNCAFGLVSADIAHEYATTKTLPAGASADEINAIYEPMIARALKTLAQEGFNERQVRLDRAVDLRYLRQVHEVTTPIRGSGSLNTDRLEQLVSDFETLYERKYGKGSAYREAGIEMTMFRLTARGVGERAKLEPIPLARSDPSAARLGRRPIFVEQTGGFGDADIYDFNRLAPGNVLPGPAVIHTPITTIVLQANQVGRVDAYRNVLIDPA